MSIKTNNNKETFKLLDVSSDSDTDFLKVELQPRKKRITRIRRGRSKSERGERLAWKERWGQRALVLAASAALLAWLAALSWAAAALAADTHRLDVALREVAKLPPPSGGDVVLGLGVNGMTAQTGGAGVPLRTGKKMRKRRELDALVGYGGGGRRAAPLLMGGSSDEREEPPPPPWLVRRGRKAPRGPCAPAARACAALLLCACATATATVVWLFIDVREQITSLRSEMELVSMGSQSVGDALQRCHSAAKELLHNHTEMAARLDQLVLRTDNITLQVKTLHDGLEEVKRQVAGAPELVAVPQRLADLQTSVARFGSQLKDMDTTVNAVRAQTTQQDELHQNVSLLKSQMDVLWNKSMMVTDAVNTDNSKYLKQQTELQTTIGQLTTNMSLINETLAAKINWATQDYKTDHHKVMDLLEAVQNNSAALSSLQTAWRQGNDVITRNITELSQKLDEKWLELQRQLSEVQELRERVAAVQREGGGPLTTPSPAAPLLASLPSQGIKSLHERDIHSIYDIPKMMANVASTILPTQNKDSSSSVSRSATGKPNILSSGSA